MSRKMSLVCGLLVVMSSGAVFAAIDLKDFDDDSMRDMDIAIKDLEPVIGAKNAIAARGDAELMRDILKQTEVYFAKKGGADDAVGFARQAEQLTATVLEKLAANDFDAAASSARALSNSCRACHDVYKPLTK